MPNLKYFNGKRNSFTLLNTYPTILDLILQKITRYYNLTIPHFTNAGQWPLERVAKQIAKNTHTILYRCKTR